MTQARIKEIIAALLSTEGRSEAEIEASQLQAAKLMAKHGLTEAEVLADNPDLLQDNTGIGRHEWIVAKFIMGPLEKLTGTKVYFEILPTKNGKRSDRKTIQFAGYRPDCEQAFWLFETIMEYGLEGALEFKGDKAKSDFLAGFGVTVAKRIRELTDKLDEVRGETGTALVVTKEAVVDDFLKTQGIHLTRTANGGRRVSDGNALEAGREAGKKVSLSRPVEGGSSGPILLN